MTEYVMIDRELIGKVSASLHDYKDGAPWGAFDLSALMELDDILAAPQQAAEPVAIAKTRREFHEYENSALEDETGYLVTHVNWIKEPQDVGALKLYTQAPAVDGAVLLDAVADAIGRDAYDCSRVWSAWGYGTMSEDDFTPLINDINRLQEIVDAVKAAIKGEG